jgi:hypothetical protein
MQLPDIGALQLSVSLGGKLQRHLFMESRCSLAAGVCCFICVVVAKDLLSLYGSIVSCFFVDGVDRGTSFDAVDIFHASTGKWSTARLSVARGNIAATSLPNLGVAIFAGGGGKLYDVFSYSCTLPCCVPNYMPYMKCARLYTLSISEAFQRF